MREAKEEEEEREDALQAKRDVTNTHISEQLRVLRRISEQSDNCVVHPSL